MFCITLKYHFWEPEVEVILIVIVLFIMLCIIHVDVGIEATACAHSADTIRYDRMSYVFSLFIWFTYLLHSSRSRQVREIL